MAERVRAGLSPAEGRKFAFTVGTAFLALAALTRWRGHVVPFIVFAALGGVLWLAGIAIPASLGPVQRGWMKLAHGISRVTTPVFLAITYFVVMMPVGLLLRAAGRNPVVHRPQQGSYWKPRTDGRGNLTNQF